MSDLGIDLKEVLEDIGTSFVIRKHVGNDVSGEYLDYDLNSQVTKPFIREFFLEAVFAYDTEVEAGDLVELSDGRTFLVMNHSPELFEDEISEYSSVLYKTNTTIRVERASGEARDSHSYESTTVWECITSGESVLLVEKEFGSSLDRDSWVGQIAIEADMCYISGNVPIEPLDRIIEASDYTGEDSDPWRRVEVVKTFDFDNVQVLHLTEDTRK